MLRYSLLLFVLLASLWAQPVTVHHVKTVSDNFPAISSTLQIYDKNDDPVQNLGPSNFHVDIDGKAVNGIQVKRFRETGVGLQIMLCLDASRSMIGRPLEAMKKAVLRFVDEMRPMDKLSVLTFADSYRLIVGFTNDKEELKQKISGIQAEGSQTALYYGTAKGLDELSSFKETGGKILLLIGDGKNENRSDSYTLQDVIDKAIKFEVPVFSIGYSRVDKSYLQTLEKISDKTGGKYYESPTDEELDVQYNKLYNQVLDMYSINFVASVIKADGLEHTGVISVASGGITKSVTWKFIAPAGAESKPESQKLSPGLIFGIIAGIVIAAFIAYLLLRRRGGKNEPAPVDQSQANIQERETERFGSEPFDGNRYSGVNNENTSIFTNKGNTDTVREKNSNRNNKSGNASNFDELEQPTKYMKNGVKSEVSGKILRLEFKSGRYNINDSGATIGRANGNTIILNSKTVSSNHLKIYLQNGSYCFQDLGSANGTFLNGRKVSQGVLKHNDTLTLGDCQANVLVF